MLLLNPGQPSTHKQNTYTDVTVVKSCVMDLVRSAPRNHICLYVCRLCNGGGCGVELLSRELLFPVKCVCESTNKIKKYSSPLFWCPMWQMEKWNGEQLLCRMADVLSVNSVLGGMSRDLEYPLSKTESHLLTSLLLLCAAFPLKLCSHNYLLYFIRSDSCQYLPSSWSTDLSRTLSVSDCTPQNIKQVSGHLCCFLQKLSGAFNLLKELRAIKGRQSIFTGKPSTTE